MRNPTEYELIDIERIYNLIKREYIQNNDVSNKEIRDKILKIRPIIPCDVECFRRLVGIDKLIFGSKLCDDTFDTFIKSFYVESEYLLYPKPKNECVIN